jgi:hypothetical protein
MALALAFPRPRVKFTQKMGPEIGPEARVDRTEVESLTPDAQAWIQALPHQVRPLELSNVYPRIANALALRWKYFHLMDHVLDDLLIDHRGGRTGFPPIIAQELLRLQAFHEARERAGQSAQIDSPP